MWVNEHHGCPLLGALPTKTSLFCAARSHVAFLSGFPELSVRVCLRECVRAYGCGRYSLCMAVPVCACICIYIFFTRTCVKTLMCLRISFTVLCVRMFFCTGWLLVRLCGDGLRLIWPNALWCLKSKSNFLCSQNKALKRSYIFVLSWDQISTVISEMSVKCVKCLVYLKRHHVTFLMNKM